MIMQSHYCVKYSDVCTVENQVENDLIRFSLSSCEGVFVWGRRRSKKLLLKATPDGPFCFLFSIKKAKNPTLVFQLAKKERGILLSVIVVTHTCCSCIKTSHCLSTMHTEYIHKKASRGSSISIIQSAFLRSHQLYLSASK